MFIKVGFKGFWIPWVRLCFEICVLPDTLKPTRGPRGKFLLSDEEDGFSFIRLKVNETESTDTARWWAKLLKKKNLSVTSANLCPVTTKHGLTCGRHHSQI